MSRKAIVRKELDGETGLYYYGARYYDPVLGRFITVDPAAADPANPQSWNRYAYCLNNPYKYIDPDGRLFWDVVDIASFAHSAYTMVTDPSLGNAGYLLWDTASLLPIVPSSGVVKGAKKGVEFAVEQATKRTVKKAPKRIAIGENMDRVRNAAKKLGDETFEGKGMEANRAWIKSKMKEGYEVHDIGPDFFRRLERKLHGKKPDSPYYGMERTETKNYPTTKLWDRTGKYEGGSSFIGE